MPRSLQLLEAQGIVFSDTVHKTPSLPVEYFSILDFGKEDPPDGGLPERTSPAT